MAPILNFKAGKVSLNEETKQCTPSPVKGEISVSLSQESEGFYDFNWKPRDSTTGVEPEDLLVIPGDVTWKHVGSCDTGRVFKLTFLSSGANSLFWMQDPNDHDDEPGKLSAKDEQISSRINVLFSESDEDVEMGGDQ